jgi:hypothetical protein
MAKKTGAEWLLERGAEMGLPTYQAIANEMGIARGNLWRYFHHQTIPNMGLMPVMCEVLFVSPTDLLRALKLLGPKQSL